MFFHLDSLAIHLHCSSQRLTLYFSELLEGWLLEPAGLQRPIGPGELTVKFELVDQLPPRPQSKHLFSAREAGLPDNVGQLAVYESDQALWLDFSDSALVRLSGLEGQTDVGGIEGVVTASVLRYGRLEDVLFTSLAPYLRRRGLFLVHAFAAVNDGRALLLVGPSGSGKTTTGLNLIHHGWQYLANDVVLLKKYPDGVYSLPMPGGFNIAAQTWTLLPWLSEGYPVAALHQTSEKRHLPAQKVVAGWGESARVAAVCFPQVAQYEASRLVREHQAVNLARLMENSLDRWDQAYLAKHISLLQLLSSQTTCYTLFLGRDTERLPERLARLLVAA